MCNFKEIEEFPTHLVCACGKIKNKRSGKLISSRLDRDGYERVKFTNGGITKHRFVHRIVAVAFIPNPEKKPQVNHINAERADNRVENLEWVTGKENIRHCYAIGNHRQDGEHNNSRKLTLSQVDAIRSSPYSSRVLGVAFGVSKTQICRIKNGQRWPKKVLIETEYLTTEQ